MKTLRFIIKWLTGLWRPNECFPAVIDSHKWESKMEMIGGLAGRYC